MHQRDKRFAWLSAAVWVLAAVLAAVAEYSPTGRSIEWLSLDSAKAVSRRSGKPIYLDVYADWCGPCKKMEKIVFLSDTVKKLLNTAFVPARLDIDDPSVTDNMKNQLKIQGVPTSIVISADGQEWDRRVGFMPTDVFLNWLRDAVSVLFATWQEWQEFSSALAQSGRGGKPTLAIAVKNQQGIEDCYSLLADSLVGRTIREEFIPTFLVATNPDHSRVIDSLYVFSRVPPNVTAVVLVFSPSSDVLGRIPLTSYSTYDVEGFVSTLLSYRE